MQAPLPPTETLQKNERSSCGRGEPFVFVALRHGGFYKPMATRLPGRRPVGMAGRLTPRERERIEGWFVEGFTVLEVYSKCLDAGILPPIDHALYAILNSEGVQQQIRARKAALAGSRIAKLVERTKSRERILDKIEATVKARGEEYAELVAGGDQGLVVFTDRKAIKVGEDWDTVDIYKTDTGLLEQWRGVLSDQAAADEILRKSLRGEARALADQELKQSAVAVANLSRQKLELEVERLRLELEELRAQSKRNAEGAYQAPSFPAVIVERLPDPVRPESIEDQAEDEDEGVTPEVPWILEDAPES